MKAIMSPKIRETLKDKRKTKDLWKGIFHLFHSEEKSVEIMIGDKLVVISLENLNEVD